MNLTYRCAFLVTNFAKMYAVQANGEVDSALSGSLRISKTVVAQSKAKATNTARGVFRVAQMVILQA